jgi:hypothetical protein
VAYFAACFWSASSLKFWWLILLVIAVVAAVVVARHDAELSRQHREHAALVARTDGQHAQTMAGDDRGIYGRDTPNKAYPNCYFGTRVPW